uniref:Uncharacterized protein MANES_13G120300 n=1 Tax=Rhizophora mucronata TaxID=61149 RepID=A0A2P2LEK4_RHIMU
MNRITFKSFLLTLKTIYAIDRQENPHFWATTLAFSAFPSVTLHIPTACPHQVVMSKELCLVADLEPQLNKQCPENQQMQQVAHMCSASSTLKTHDILRILELVLARCNLAPD